MGGHFIHHFNPRDARGFQLAARAVAAMEQAVRPLVGGALLRQAQGGQEAVTAQAHMCCIFLSHCCAKLARLAPALATAAAAGAPGAVYLAGLSAKVQKYFTLAIEAAPHGMAARYEAIVAQGCPDCDTARNHKVRFRAQRCWFGLAARRSQRVSSGVPGCAGEETQS
jgi:hypothetical protein